MRYQPRFYPSHSALCCLLFLTLLPWTALSVQARGFSEPPSKAANSDPALHTEYSSLCTWRWTCGGVQGQMRWPTTGSCWNDAVRDMPLAVILHGNGFNYRDYDYLQDHLARNGILSASVNKVAAGETAADHQVVADAAETYLTSACFQSNFLDNFSSADPVDFERTALIGHSRGGESVRYLANNLSTNPDFTVRAVVSMAPTRATTASLYGTKTPAYMLLYGTHDEDVEPDAAFESHDLAGWNEISTPTSYDLDRSMKLFIGGFHNGFSDDSVGLFPVQWEVAQGYVNAFLHAWLLNDWQFYSGYVRGDQVPGTWGNGISSQFSSSVARRVIDNFEDFSVTPNTLGGAVTTYGVASIAAVSATPIAETSHAGRILRFTPGQDNAYVAWDIPVGQRNANGYLYLSLRLGMLEGSGPISGRLWIKNGANYAWVDLADYGGVPEPTVMCTQSAALSCITYEDQGYMRTLRVPLSAFGSHNDVQRVYLQFLSGAVGDDFMVDNVEFSDAFVIVNP